MKTIFGQLKNSLDHQESSVLVSIVAGSGSTPRVAGAKMLVLPSGQIFGTIGGGAIEFKSQQLALEAINNKQSYIQGFSLSPNQIADLGMICGGDVEVFFQFVGQLFIKYQAMV